MSPVIEKAKNHTEDVRDRFLRWLSKPRIKSEGGYAPVDRESLFELDALISLLIKARWEGDEDGDLPIEYTLVNRTTHHRLHFRPVPYGACLGRHQHLDPESPDAFLVDAGEYLANQANLRIAHEDAAAGQDYLITKAMGVADATIAKRDQQDRPALRGRKDAKP